jgi:hypothetical protein
MKFANPLKKLRNITSTLGHSIDFPGKGTKKEACPEGLEPDANGFVWVFVPPAIVPEAVAAGFMPDSEVQEEDEDELPTAPTDSDERQLAMFEAFDKLVARGAREDFTASGSPRVDAVEKVLGWKPDKNEMRDAWIANQAKKD